MRDVAFLTRLYQTTWLLALALLVGAGCSGCGSPATSQVADPKIAEIIKNTKNPKERRTLINQARLRRTDPDVAGAAPPPPPKSKSAPGKTAPRKR